jgi:cell filamentation protein
VTDPYLWPDGSCLKNKLGIRDPERLAKFETIIVSSRNMELTREILPGEYNLQHFQRFRWWLFRDVYDWAGKARTVNITKDGLQFASWRYLDEQVSAVLNELAEDRWLIGRSRQSFVDKLAFYYGELNVRHSFREGNGRTQRAFLRQLSAAAGWRLDWSALNKDDNIAACRENLRTATHVQLAEVLDPVIMRI